MRKPMILLALALQLLYLGGLAGQREYLARRGETVFLRTAPVDPRDLFRGDYVTLDYALNHVSAGALRGEVAERLDEAGYPVYAALRRSVGSEDLYELDYLSDAAPTEGHYLAGRLEKDWRFPAARGNASVRYGIESYFVEQGKGLEIEERRGEREGLQIPMEIELAVGFGGDAVIRGFRWSPIGLQFEMSRFEELTFSESRNLSAERRRELRAPEVRMTLQNVGEQARWIVDPGDHCAFKIVGQMAGSRPSPMADESCEDVPVSAADFHRLEPGETYTANIDLDLPRWHIETDDGAVTVVALGDLSQPQFRMSYAPDPRWAESAPSAVLEGEIWLVAMASPRFSAIGRVD